MRGVARSASRSNGSEVPYNEELAAAIRAVLARAARGKLASGQAGPHPHYLTAYQILRRLPEPLHQALINEYGEPGKAAGRHFTSVSRIAQLAREIADHDYMARES